MLRLIAVFAIFLTITPPLYSQHEGKYKEDSAKVFRVSLQTFRIQSGTSEFTRVLPLKYIHFYDSRIDTSYLFLFQKKYRNVLNLYRQESQRMMLTGGFSEEYTQYLQEYFALQLNSEEESGVHCFFKRLRISAADTIADAIRSRDIMLANLTLELECFYQKGNECYPAMRIDTSFGVKLTTTSGGEMANEVLHELTAALSRKLNSIDFSRIINRKAYTAQEMHSRYAGQYADMPLLQQKTFKKGIYKTFKEWQLNQPSVPGNFTIQKDEKKLFTLWDADNNIVPVHKTFGVFDGKYFWVQSVGNLFPLIRVHNNWEFYGVAMSQFVGSNSPGVSGAGKFTGGTVRPNVGMGSYSGASGVEAVEVNPVLYCLHGIDLETGLIY